MLTDDHLVAIGEAMAEGLVALRNETTLQIVEDIEIESRTVHLEGDYGRGVDGNADMLLFRDFFKLRNVLVEEPTDD